MPADVTRPGMRPANAARQASARGGGPTRVPRSAQGAVGEMTPAPDGAPGTRALSSEEITGIGAPAAPQESTSPGVLSDRDVADADRTSLAYPPPASHARDGPHRPATPGTGSRLTRVTRLPGSGDAAEGPFSPGEAFGSRYRILRLLGMGGMGAVYQAWDDELEVAVALKVIRPDAAPDATTAADIERRFKRELLLARQVTHPNVVRIHDLGDVDGIKYITMPYVEGPDLAGILAEEGTLPVPRALALARQVASGLSAAHAAGVVHRDLKPANIMVDAEGRALIMDFGIARTVTGPADRAGRGGPSPVRHSDATVVGAVVGTLEYMAPEQARGQAVDQRADIYAFGLILARMLVGKRLMPGATDAYTDLMARLEKEPPRIRTYDESIPEALEAVIATCLQPDAANRFQTTEELVAALNALDDDGTLRPVPPRLLRSPKFWIAVSVITLIVVLSTWRVALSVITPVEAPKRDPIAVLVADFDNRTGDPIFDGLLEQSIGVGIEGASFITAYQRPGALRIARQINAGTRLDENAARLVSMREGVKVVLTGAIEPRGEGFQITVRGLDPATGQQVLETSGRAGTRDEVLAVAGRLSTEVRSALGDSKATEARETFSASSLEAVGDYVKAQELAVGGRFEESIIYYRRATERDPKFGRAWGGWATASTRLGRKVEADELWKQALTLTDRMGERERLRMLGVYYSLVARNYDKARETFEQLVEAYPADGAGHNNLAVAYFRKREFKKALEEGRRVLQIYPKSPLYRSNFALYAMYAGDFDTATTVGRELVDEGQAAYDTYLPLAMAALAAGDRDATEAAYASMAGAGESGESLAITGRADLALFDGRIADAIALLDEGIAADTKAGNAPGIATKQIVKAEALALLGRTPAAAEAARRALAADRSDTIAARAAPLLIAAGAEADALKLGADLDNKLEEGSRAYGRIIAGQVALARGRRVEAVDAFKDAIQLADVWLARFLLGRAYLEAEAVAEALSEFETCLQRRGEASALFLDDVPTARYVPPLYYWMGRAEEGLGLLPRAREHYAAFLSYRADGSPDPLVKDAKARLGR